MKVCSGCHIAQSPEAFARGRARCRACVRLYQRQRYQRNKECGPLEITTKVCSRCHTTKATEDFYHSPSSANGYSSYCRACAKQHAVEYQASHPETRERKHARWMTRYGLTPTTYQALLNQQHGRCAICRCLPSPHKRLAVDHDHACCPDQSSCGQCIRGLLCDRCNHGLGNFQDTISYLQNAMTYLTVTSAA
jgi:hypothetical protein